MPAVNPMMVWDEDMNRLGQISNHMIAHQSDFAPQDISAAMQAYVNGGLVRGQADTLSEALRNAVYDRYRDLYSPWDFEPRNISFTPEGNLIGHDGGMVMAGYGQPKIQRYSPVIPRGYQSGLPQKLTDMGVEDEVRRILAEGVNTGARGQGVPPGAFDPITAERIRKAVEQRQSVQDILSRFGHLAGPRPAAPVSLRPVTPSAPNTAERLALQGEFGSAWGSPETLSPASPPGSPTSLAPDSQALSLLAAILGGAGAYGAHQYQEA